MHDSQLTVLQGSLRCLQQGHAITLVSVAATWGTSPRQVGSLLAVSSDGQFFGSVSGGCVEEDLIERLVQQPVQAPQLIRYGETATERHRFGLPCGGVLQLVAEPLNDINEVQALISELTQRRAVLRQTCLTSGANERHAYRGQVAPKLSSQHWCNVFGPVWHLVIVGAGETGRYLAEMAGALGFAVTVSDPRPDYRSNWPLAHLPLAEGYPDDVIAALNIDPRTAIVTVAHDPRVDDMALLQALKSPAFYVGALGSHANNQARRQRLQEHLGFSAAEVARLAGPVGLPLGSKTPAEIALAIMAEIVALKNGIDLRAQLAPTEPAASPVCSLAAG